DAAFAVHPDMKSHTGYTMTMGEGAIISSSRKQKLNTRSSTESELVACDDAMTQVLWTKQFLEHQGYETDAIMHQDNTSTIQLEKNGKASSHKRTRHINIRYFFIKDQIDKGVIQIQYCPTDKMDADFMSKATQAETFNRLRNKIMGM
ncbi:MAG: Ty1/Copia family ribonuclease HI, partial [Bacteroidota bacterium]